MWTQLLPILIPVAIQAAKRVGLASLIPQGWGKVLYPALSLSLGAIAGMGWAGESSMAMAALEGAGVSGLSAIGVHSAAKNIAEAFRR